MIVRDLIGLETDCASGYFFTFVWQVLAPTIHRKPSGISHNLSISWEIKDAHSMLPMEKHIPLLIAWVSLCACKLSPPFSAVCDSTVSDSSSTLLCCAPRCVILGKLSGNASFDGIVS